MKSDKSVVIKATEPKTLRGFVRLVTASSVVLIGLNHLLVFSAIWRSTLFNTALYLEEQIALNAVVVDLSGIKIVRGGS